MRKKYVLKPGGPEVGVAAFFQFRLLKKKFATYVQKPGDPKGQGRPGESSAPIAVNIEIATQQQRHVAATQNTNKLL